MTLAARILSATIGRAVPRYRTLGEWAETYRKIVDSKPIEGKTKENRRVENAFNLTLVYSHKL